MAGHTNRPTAVQRAANLAQTQEITADELLTLYLDTPKKEREALFADTSRAAEIVDVSQHTIQLWITIGLVGAIRIGKKKYKVSLNSLRDFLRQRLDD